MQTAAALDLCRRLKPRQVVAEFEHHLEEELDLLREAANASQLRRNFAGSTLLVVPEVYWDLCSQRVMVMERMRGTPISQIRVLREKGIDIPALARAGQLFVYRFQLAILFHNFAQAAQLLGGFSIGRGIRQQLWRREFIRQLFITGFDLL